MTKIIAVPHRANGLNRFITRSLLLTLTTLGSAGLGGCSSGVPSYETPEVAVDSLVGALRAGKTDEISRVLGPESDKLLASGDQTADTNGRSEFVRLYDERHKLTADGNGAMILDVGSTDWPLPIPIVKGDKGWYFDTAAGLDELLSRRIGRNELFAIGTCRAMADAEKEYAAADYDGNGWCEYARTFGSDPGKKNGLYWPTAPGEKESPLGELVAEAKAQGYGGGKQTLGDTSRPFHGYYFRILTAQGNAAPGGAMNFVAQGHMIGGFGIIAWPVEYANSGLKSFIVSHHGQVYEKDLGDDTDKIARAMTEFNPDKGWEVSKDTDK